MQPVVMIVRLMDTGVIGKVISASLPMLLKMRSRLKDGSNISKNVKTRKSYAYKKKWKTMNRTIFS
jgi:hypothetical protein